MHDNNVSSAKRRPTKTVYQSVRVNDCISTRGKSAGTPTTSTASICADNSIICRSDKYLWYGVNGLHQRQESEDSTPDNMGDDNKISFFTV